MPVDGVGSGPDLPAPPSDPVDTSGGADGGSGAGPVGPASGSAPVAGDGGGDSGSTPAAPAAPQDTFTPAAAPAAPSGPSASAPAELQKQIEDNRKALSEAYRSDDPSRNFFEMAQKAQERSDLLKKAQQHAPEKDRAKLGTDSSNFGAIAASRVQEFKDSPARQAQFKDLSPDQQKQWQSLTDRVDKETAERKAAEAARPPTPREQAVSDASKKFYQVAKATEGGSRDPEKALNVARTWDAAEEARKKAYPNEPATSDWVGIKKDALEQPDLDKATPEQRSQLLRERQTASYQFDQAHVRELDKKIEDVKAGKGSGNLADLERYRASAQDRINSYEGKPPGEEYRVERAQVDQQRAEVDRKIAELKQGAAPKPAGTDGQGQTQGQGDTAAQAREDSAKAAELKKLEQQRADLDARSTKLDKYQQTKLAVHGFDQADRAAAPHQQRADALEKERADVQKQLADPSLTAERRAELEGRAQSLDKDLTGAQADAAKARQGALDKAREDARKAGPDQAWQRGEDFKDQLFKHHHDPEVQAATDAHQRAKENLAATTRSLEQARKEAAALEKGTQRNEVNGKPVPQSEAVRDARARVRELEQAEATDRAKEADARAKVAGHDTHAAELELERRKAYAQAAAGEAGIERMGQSFGEMGLPSEIEKGLKSQDPATAQAAGTKALEWLTQHSVSDAQKRELEGLAKKYGFDPVPDKRAYQYAQNAAGADRDLQQAQQRARTAADDASAARRDLETLGGRPVPPEPNLRPEAPRLPGAGDKTPPAPAQAPAPTQPEQAPQAEGTRPPAAPEKARDPINPAFSPEDKAHLERQAKEMEERGQAVLTEINSLAGKVISSLPPDALKTLTEAAAANGGKLPQGTELGLGLDLPEGVKDALHSAIKTALEDPTVMKALMEKERQGVGFAKGAMDMAGGLYSLGKMGAGAISDLVSDPKGAFDKAVDGLSWAAQHPDEVARSVGDALAKAPELAGKIKDAVVEAYKRDPEEFKGRAAFEVLSLLLPASKAGTAGKVAAEVGDGLRLAERAGEVANLAGKTERGAAELGNLAGKTQEAAKAVEAGQAGSKLAAGSKEYVALQQKVEAQEELARRLRDSLSGGRHELPPGARGHAMTGATGGTPPEALRPQIAKLEKEAEEGRKALAEADAAAAAAPTPPAVAAAPKNVWITNPKEFPHKINGSVPSRGMVNGNGTVRYQWLDDQKRVIQETVVTKDGRVRWGQAQAGLVDVAEGTRPANTPNPIRGAPADNKIRGHFVPYELTGPTSNSGANLDFQGVIMNGTNPYRGLEEKAVEFGKEHPGLAKYLVIGMGDDGKAMDTARRQVLWFRAPAPTPNGRVATVFDQTTKEINDATSNLEKALLKKRGGAPAPAPVPAPVAPPPAPPPGG